jgi:[ribosomal protein S5]-alanine N-acetyltransferase
MGMYRAMSGGFFLKSARLGFRCWQEKDLPLALELWGNADVTLLIGGPFSPQMVEARLLQEIENMRLHGVQYWPIFLLEYGQHVGCAGLRPYRLEQCIYELGFHLRPAFWQQGLAHEAAQAVIDFAFGQLNAEGLFAGHHPSNVSSCHLLLKLGFARTHEELYSPTGLLHPSYLLQNPRK